ncbi:MAG TPA: DUF3443 family protein [Terriglobales bacterium]
MPHSFSRLREPDTGMRSFTLGLLGSLIAIAIAVCAGCGGSGANASEPMKSPMTISLSASTINVNQGGSAKITAKVTGDVGNAGVSWAQSGPAAGRLINATSTEITYNAPKAIASGSMATITATSNVDKSVTSSIEIFVSAPTITIQLSANPADIKAGGTSDITAVVAGDPTNGGVTWSQSGPAGGSLSNATSTSVTYNAPASVNGTEVATITATAKANTGVTASIPVTITGTTMNIVVSLVASPTTIDQNSTSTLTATVTGDPTNAGVSWSISPSGAGAFTAQNTTSATYRSPTAASAEEVVITATANASASGGGKAGAASTPITVLPSGAASNVEALNVDGGPVIDQVYRNGAFASATVCLPDSSVNCVTVDHLLVDTGSNGLRVLGTQLTNLTLTPATVGSKTLYDCAIRHDGSFLWGAVALADVYVSGEKAMGIPVQVVADPTGGAGDIPSGCSGNGAIDEDTQKALGANGILGVGPEPTDCTLAGVNHCDGSAGAPLPVYYACSGSSLACESNIRVARAQQITNPVAAFTADNNGTVVSFPAVAAAQARVTGTITFGIATRANNAIPTAVTVYQMDANDNFQTVYYGPPLQYLPHSLIETGANAYLIPNPNESIAVCSDMVEFFCPSTVFDTSAQNAGANRTLGPLVEFSVENADTLLGGSLDAGFGSLAGPNGTTPCVNDGGTYTGSCTFDWGLPFFFGRTVYTSIDMATVSNEPVTPWWAY